MTNSYDKFAFASVNRFVLAMLDDFNIMTSVVTYKGEEHSGITPGGEIPELTDADLKNNTEAETAYIVYGVSRSAKQKQYSDEETLLYTIYATKARKVMQIANFVSDLTGRFDWSAEHINNWNDTQDDQNFHFLQMTCEQIIGPEPVRMEGGRYATMLQVKYSFVTDQIGDPGSDFKGMRL